VDKVQAKPSDLRIFLCHSSHDKPNVRELYQQLQVEGIDPWLDEEKLLPGQNWQLQIRKAVHSSDIVIVCLSRTAINKAGYIHKEIKYALDIADQQPEDTIFIIPVRFEECKVPEVLSKWQWVDLFEDRGFKKLMNSLSKVQIDKKNENQNEEIEKDFYNPSDAWNELRKLSLNIIVEGKEILNKIEYYDEICECMDEMLPGDQVFAINNIYDTRWSYEQGVDLYQNRYLVAIKNALNRGVIINRLFIFPNHLPLEKKVNFLQKQINEGIKVYVIWDHIKLNKSYKRNLVIFQGKKRHIVFEDFCNPVDINRISAGLKYIYEKDFVELTQLWEEIMLMSESIHLSYLFSWNDIPGKDNNRLIGFLKKRFDIEWVDNAKIKKIDDDNTIRLYFKNNFLTLKLNDDETKVILKIDDVRTDEFIAKTEKDKLNIYHQSM